MKNSQRLVLFGFLALFFLTIFSYLVAKGKLNYLDLLITTRLQNMIPRKDDIFLSFFSILGTFEVTTLVLVGFLVLRKKIDGLIVFAFYTIGSLIEIFGKSFVYHASPPSRFFRYDLNFILPSAYVQTGYSYPSGHAMRTTFLIVILAIALWQSQKIKRNVKVMGLLFMSFFLVIMFVSRISLGEHWTSDVIAGFLLGSSLGLFTFSEQLKSLFHRTLKLININ